MNQVRRVLVAEDNVINQKILKMLLESMGIQVEIAADGASALAAARSGGFDLVLMDIQMPVLNGLQATRRMRDEGICLPVIVVTAHALEEMERMAFQAGADAFVTKPVAKADLADTINSVMRGVGV